MSAELALVAADGHALSARLYGNPETARYALVVNSALGIKQIYYAPFARWMGERGACVLTFDYRGNGQSGGRALRRLRATLTDWGRLDFAAAVDHLARAAPGLPIICIAHSIGGQLAALPPGKSRLAGIFAVCSQHGHWRWWSGTRKLRSLWLCHVIVPLTTLVCGYFPGSRFGMADLPAGVAREWARWCRTRGYPRDASGEPTRPGFEAIRGPAAFLSIHDDDLFAPARAVDELCGLYANARRERIHIDPAGAAGRRIGHFGFFLSSPGRRFWPHVEDWLVRHFAGFGNEEKGARMGEFHASLRDVGEAIR